MFFATIQWCNYAYKNLKDAIKTKTKNLRRNLKALTQLHCIKLTAGYIFVKETIMRLRKFVFYIPGILLKKQI